MSVDFWFNSVWPISTLQVLFQQRAKEQLTMTIGLVAQGETRKLACVPFGALSESNMNVAVFETFVAEETAFNWQWMHVSCSYDQETKKVQGFFFDGTTEHEAFLTIQDQSQAIRLSDQFQVSLGGAFEGQLSNSVSFRELRIWNSVMTLEQIQAVRHYSLEANHQVENNGLKSYLRFAEGSYQFIDAAQSVIMEETTIVDAFPFTFKSVTGLTVCSTQSFFDNDFCYTNPFLSISIFYSLETTINAENGETEFNYVISSENSELISEDALVNRLWKFKDPVLQSIADEQVDAVKIIIPQKAVR